jgi:dihydroorotase-like cyclic amidohydrolase
MLVTVHCENYAAIGWRNEALRAAGLSAPKYHACSRPVMVERDATYRAIALAALVDQRPSPRDDDAAEGLWKAIKDGVIGSISSDHRSDCMQGSRRKRHAGDAPVFPDSLNGLPGLPRGCR